MIKTVLRLVDSIILKYRLSESSLELFAHHINDLLELVSCLFWKFNLVVRTFCVEFNLLSNIVVHMLSTESYLKLVSEVIIADLCQLFYFIVLSVIGFACKSDETESLF